MGRRLFEMVGNARAWHDEEVGLPAPAGLELHGIAPGDRVELRGARGSTVTREVLRIESPANCPLELMVRRTRTPDTLMSPVTVWATAETAFARYQTTDALLKRAFHPWPNTGLAPGRRVLLWRGVIVAVLGGSVRATIVVERDSDHQRRALLVCRRHEEECVPSPEPVLLRSWDDPVEKLLRNTPLLEEPHDSHVLDGVAFAVDAFGEAALSIRFSNPTRDGGLLRLANALAEAANHIAAAQDDAVSQQFHQEIERRRRDE